MLAYRIRTSHNISRRSEKVNEQPESIPIIKEEIFGLLIAHVQYGAVTPEDYLIPEHHLVQRLTHKKVN